jgi:hypothetical protein
MGNQYRLELVECPSKPRAKELAALLNEALDYLKPEEG